MKRIAAALTLFTRIPFWKWTDTPSEAYPSAVVFWPLAGWLTGAVTAGVFSGLSFLLPTLPAIILALVARLLLTGALHEDGLADVCDGFGGGRDKESVLRIMKDSHIGTYGTIGLICYFLLVISVLASLPYPLIALTIIAIDPFSKFCASQLVNILPYARPEGAKNKIRYPKMTAFQFIQNMLSGCIPLIPLVLTEYQTSLSVILPAVTLFCLIHLMRRRIGGYTGDCCGATFSICEAAMLVGVCITVNL